MCTHRCKACAASPGAHDQAQATPQHTVPPNLAYHGRLSSLLYRRQDDTVLITGRSHLLPAHACAPLCFPAIPNPHATCVFIASSVENNALWPCAAHSALPDTIEPHEANWCNSSASLRADQHVGPRPPPCVVLPTVPHLQQRPKTRSPQCQSEPACRSLAAERFIGVEPPALRCYRRSSLRQHSHR